MKNNNRIVKSGIGVAVCCMVLALASPSFAQWGGYRGRGNERVNLDRVIRQAENRSDQFVRLFDRALDRSRMDGSWREDRLNVRAMDLERQMNIIRQQFNQQYGRTNSLIPLRVHVANAMNVAQSINQVMRNRRLDPVVERQWSLLRSDLNRMASAFNVRQI
jgi:hypothetical protein